MSLRNLLGNEEYEAMKTRWEAAQARAKVAHLARIQRNTTPLRSKLLEARAQEMYPL